MNRETTRPLLAGEVAKLVYLEEEARQKALSWAEEATAWKELAEAREHYQEARLKRAQAELQLWLADRQWEREEMLGLAGHQTSEAVLQGTKA